MEPHSYNEESVQALVGWAQELVDSQKYPTGEFIMRECAVILDCKHFLESMIAVILRNWENPTFYPTIDHLWEFKKKFEGLEQTQE